MIQPSPTTGASSRVWPSVLVCLALIGITGVAYLNADHEEFLFDSAQPDLLSSPAQDWRQTLHDFWREPLKPGQQLTTLTFAANYQVNRAVGLDGLDATGFLAVNVLLHGISAFLVFFLLRALFRQVYPDRPVPLLLPAGLALLFAVHPVHASSVAYIIQRRGILATLFYLLGVLAWLRARQAGGFMTARNEGRPASGSPGKAPSQRSLPRFAIFALLTLACYWLAFRSKEMALTLPFTILLIEFVLRAGRWTAPRFAVLAGGLATAYIALMGAGLAVIGRASLSGRSASAYGEHLDWGVWVHFLSMCRAVTHYWKVLLVPLPNWICIDHDFALSRGLFEHGAWAAMLLHVLLLLAGFVAIRRGHTLIGLGILWFYVVQIPYMLLPQRELLVEYKAYLPSVGVVLILAGALSSLRLPGPRKAALAGLGLAAGVLLVLTLRGNVAYQSPYKLWSDALAKSPTNARAAAGVAQALITMGRPDEAAEQLNAALKKIQSDDSLMGRVRRFALLNNLGDALMKSNRPAQAAEHFLAAVTMNPEHATALHNLGFALAQMGQHKTAVGCYERALRTEPDRADTHFELANAYVLLNNLDKAERHYAEVIRLQPDRAIAHSHLAKVFSIQRKMDQALAGYRQALQLDPNLAQAHKHLADLLYQSGAKSEAIEHYRKAIQLDASYPEAYNNLANVLALEGGQDDEALELYSRAVAGAPDYLPARENKADLLLKLGRVEEAVAEYEHILAIQPQDERVRTKLTAATQPAAQN